MANDQADIFQTLTELVALWDEDHTQGSPVHCHNVPGKWDGDSEHPKGSHCRECELHDQVREFVRNRPATALDQLALPPGLQPDALALMAAFAKSIAIRMIQRGLSGEWKAANWIDACRDRLQQAQKKGDPVEVALYSAFLWYHGEPTFKPGS